MPGNTIKAGDFEAEIRGPYPCWLALKYRGQEVLTTVRHDELRYLAFVIERAMQESKLRLKSSKNDDEV